MRLSAPILDRSSLIAEAHRLREEKKTIAFANGCFDLLHVGHIRYLQEAAGVADVLVVGINSDASVRKIKGEGRPLVQERERAEVIAAIRGVGMVTIFEEESPADLIRQLQPEYQCKGTDYTPDSVPEAGIVRSYGGRVVITGDPKAHSSTDLLGKMRG